MEPEIVVSDEAAGHVRAAVHSPRIGSRLRAARRTRGMTIAELASAADLSNGFISLLERDETNASVATLLRICELLGVRIGSLFEQPRTSLARKRDRDVVQLSVGLERVRLVSAPAARLDGRLDHLERSLPSRREDDVLDPEAAEVHDLAVSLPREARSRLLEQRSDPYAQQLADA